MAAYTALAPLHPPFMGDDLMYHLPHAQQWALQGRLQVNDWIRYPWFQFYFQLLYAAALSLYDDVTPLLLHALTGWLTALLIYGIGVRYATRLIASFAVIGWFALVRPEFADAYIDMALTLFLLLAWFAYLLWREQPQKRDWLVVAAFMLGVAAGTKYQALPFLPLFALAVLWHDRRWSTLGLALLSGLVPCVYWYLRNLLVTGDPFNPLGGQIFGFYDWNLADLQYQVLDLKNVRAWPHPLLWPASIAPVIAANWRRRPLRAAMVASIYAFLVWLFTSGYPRYLIPAYPLLLLLSAKVVCDAFSLIGRALRRHLTLAFSLSGWGRIEGALLAAVLLLGLPAPARNLVRDWGRVTATSAERDAFLAHRLWEYKSTLDFLNGLPSARIYQNGMEAVPFYSRHPIRGDHFGRWRYRDFTTLPPNALAARLTELDINTLVLRLKFNQQLLTDPRFFDCFEEIHRDRTFGVYRINTCAPPSATELSTSTGSARPGFVIGPTNQNR